MTISKRSKRIAAAHAVPGTLPLTEMTAQARSADGKSWLGTREASERLAALAFLERACAHILAGWIVKVPDLDVKIEWGQQFAASMEASSRLRDRAAALAAGQELTARVPGGWRADALAADSS